MTSQRQQELIACEHCGKPVRVHAVADPYCRDCGTWHLRGYHADGRTDPSVSLEEKVRALPVKGINHTGPYVERAAVLALLR